MTDQSLPQGSRGFRKQYLFWLETGNPKQVELMLAIAELKQKKSFHDTIRNGLRLILDLRAGRTEVLFELFPWVKEQLIAVIAAPIQTSHSAIQPVQRKPIEPINADDDLPELTIVESTSKENPTFNMILSTMSIGARPENIPREILEYGIEMGRVSPSALAEHDRVRGNNQLSKIGELTVATPSPSPADPKVMAGSNLEFDTEIADDELDFLLGDLDIVVQTP